MPNSIRFLNARTVKRKCEQCGNQFIARQADLNRGWARFCGKSCAALFRARNHKPKSLRKSANVPKLEPLKREVALNTNYDASFAEWDRIVAEEDGVPTPPIRRRTPYR